MTTPPVKWDLILRFFLNNAFYFGYPLEELFLLTFYPLRLHAEEVGTCSTVIETFSHLTKLLS